VHGVNTAMTAITISNEKVKETLGTMSVPADLYVGNVIGAFSRALSDKIDSAIRSAVGLSSSACYAIVQVGTNPHSTIEELRRMLALEHSSVVRLLDRLEKHGILERKRGAAGDQRQVRVKLSEQGEEFFSKILTARRLVLDGVVTSLNCEEKELVSSIIRKLMPNLVNPGDNQRYVCRLCELEVCHHEVCPVNLAHSDFFVLPDNPFRRISGNSIISKFE